MYLRKLGPIIYSQDHSALSKLAFLVDSIQKKKYVQEKKKKNIQEQWHYSVFVSFITETAASC